MSEDMQKPNSEKPASSAAMGNDDAEKTMFSLAVGFARQGNMGEARRLLQVVLEEDRDNEMAWIWLASTYSSDTERLRILQYHLDRHPESDLVGKTVLVIRDRLSRRKSRVVAEEVSVEPLSRSIPAGQPTEEIQVTNALASQTWTTPEINRSAYPLAAAAPTPLPEEEKEESASESTLLLIAIAVIAITVISALLWTMLT